MEFHPYFHSPLRVRGLRPVLQDISSTPFIMRGGATNANVAVIPDPYVAPSPEEQIIRQRTQHQYRLAAFYYLPYDTDDEVEFLQMTPAKEGALDRLSRKRLMMSPPSMTSSPLKDEFTPAKRQRLDKSSRVHSPICVSTEDDSFRNRLGAFTQDQLIDVLDSLVISHPELQQEVQERLGSPDLVTLEEKLKSLRHAVYKHLPTRRYGSSRDASSFRKVKFYLEEFKQTCLTQARVLGASGQAPVAVTYCLMALKYVHQLPVWDDASHNLLREKLLSFLETVCRRCLNEGKFTRQQLIQLQPKMKRAISITKAFGECREKLECLIISS